MPVVMTARFLGAAFSELRLDLHRCITDQHQRVRTSSYLRMRMELAILLITITESLAILTTVANQRFGHDSIIVVDDDCLRRAKRTMHHKRTIGMQRRFYRITAVAVPPPIAAPKGKRRTGHVATARTNA